MIIGIDGSRAFLEKRTGIEEYSYQVIKHLRDQLKENRVIVYVRADQEVDFDLPENWCVKKLWAPRFWTQIRLSLEMLLYAPDVLFVPAHTVPIIHPKNTVVVVHGLEYEFCPKAYSWWSRLSIRTAIRFSCRVASCVVCVSENTKRDVMHLYGTPEERISVVYEGYESNSGDNVCETNARAIFRPRAEYRKSAEKIPEPSSYRHDTPYILFVGRIEERKNIVRFVDAFEKLKQETGCAHKLVLAGKWGYGHESIRKKIEESARKEDIEVLGYVSEEEKWVLLKHADMFLFATLYEGFGIPVLEAQSAGIPVIVSDNSSLPEVAGEGALSVNPESIEEIAQAMKKLVSDNGPRNDIIRKGKENVERFSWEKCARKIMVLLKNE